MIAPVESLAHLSPDEFLRRHLVPRRPFVLRGGVASWPALTRWTPARFRELFGELEVELQGHDFGILAVKRLREFIDELDALEARGGELPYLRWSDARGGVTERMFEVLRDDWSRPAFLPERRYVQPLEWRHSAPNRRRYPASGIYLSPRGAITKLHVDRGRSNAILAQVHGSKHCLLISPEQRPGLDLRRWSAHPLGSAAQRAALAGLDVLEATLMPGDVLFIPNQWVHEVHTTATSISLTYNFVHALEAHHWLAFAAFDTFVIQPLERLHASACRYQDTKLWP
jgi:hypothetical protein